MASRAASSPTVTPRAQFDPLYTLWKILTNVKFALTLIGFAVLGGLLGVVFPQMPAPMRSNAEARAAWLELQRQDFGSLTPWMERAGLFDVFHTYWFNGLWAVIALAVAVSSVSRIRPIIRTVRRPPKEVNDRYFDLAHNRAAFAHPGGVSAVTEALRRRRYAVEVTSERDGATYVFAERFAWAHYGTLVSHLALLIFMVGALLTRFAGFDETLALAETKAGAPVFESAGPGQIFVTMLDAHRGIDSEGNIVDYRSQIEVRRGDETVACESTVNDPCHAFGYKFHQAAFFDDLARLRINSPNGATLFDDIVDFNNEALAVPVLRVDAPGDSKIAAIEAAVPQLEVDSGASPNRADDIALGVVRWRFEDPEVFVAWRFVAGEMRVLLTDRDGNVLPLVPGGRGSLAGREYTFVGATAIPAARIDDMPGSSGPVHLQLTEDPWGSEQLTIVGLTDFPMTIAAGGYKNSDEGYVYRFAGRAEGSGINIRRDPGDTFIWLAVGMAFLGLGITFYVPRRRLWAKVTPERTQLAGIAERTARFARELRYIGADTGAPDALLPGDRRRGED